MKLRAKFQDEDFDLGEVVDADVNTTPDGFIEFQEAKAGGRRVIIYDTLERFFGDWGDAPEDAPEEPKTYWYLTSNGTAYCAGDIDDDIDRAHKQIGNYFESEKEAKRAVEKLKAWTRLKDFGCGFMLDDHFTVKFVGPDARKITSAEEQKSLSDVYKLLFGGEDE